MTPAISSLQGEAVSIEATIAGFMGKKIEEFRKVHGDRLANELLMSTAALMSARTIGMVHVYTGEKVDSVRNRFVATLDDDLKPTIRKIYEFMATSKEKKKS